MNRVLARTPLRVKLVAAVMALVTAALLVISVASTWALKTYLLDRVDSQLNAVANTATASQLLSFNGQVVLPTDFYARMTSTEGAGRGAVYDRRLGIDDLPPLVTGANAVDAVQGKPYTVVSPSGRVRWRMLVTVLPNGAVLHVGDNLSSVDNAVSRLVFSELLVGAGVLILLALLGAALVRASLRSLREIEHTAAAISTGDLTQRVPEFEPGEQEPRTEVGRVGRALNTMLGHVEAAFTAQAASEAAARNAARAAQLSEARARRSEDRMRQFVADASHELRTPLTTIRGFAELYRQGAARAPEQVAELIGRIEAEASRMGLLVEDLLMLARLDQQRPLDVGPTDLLVIANDAVTGARVVDPDRKITLAVPEGTGQLIVSGDESRLRQVVGNLMTNALTHTPPEASVWLRLYREDGCAVIEVADNGPGLAPDQLERVFERFYRADAARTRRPGTTAVPSSGTGLGLAIVAALVKAHGGSVEVQSEPGAGATFRVRLPLATAQIPGPEPAIP